MNTIAERLAAVRERIAASSRSCGRAPTDVTLLAVSKTKPAAAIREAWQAGQVAFGENYLQDALPKIEALADLPLEWHFIGRIQGNKTEAIARHFDWVHGLDSAKHARQLDRHRLPGAGPLNVCIQLNLSEETSKGGISESQLADLASTVAALPNLRLRGLMTMPAPGDTPEAQAATFRRLAGLLETVRRAAPTADTLSMGMSGDMEAAIRAGSTMVRIGTDIFGPRA